MVFFGLQSRKLEESDRRDLMFCLLLPAQCMLLALWMQGGGARGSERINEIRAANGVAPMVNSGHRLVRCLFFPSDNDAASDGVE